MELAVPDGYFDNRSGESSCPVEEEEEGKIIGRGGGIGGIGSVRFRNQKDGLQCLG